MALKRSFRDGLTRALALLRRYRRDDVRFCILREAVVSYARPFSGNRGPTAKNALAATKFVPAIHRALHDELMALRMQILAHTDFTFHQPQLMKWPTDGRPVFPMSLRRPPYESLLARLAAIESLVEAVESRLHDAIHQIERSS